MITGIVTEEMVDQEWYMSDINTSMYAVLDDNIVENIIIAESKEIAEQITNKICIQQTSLTGTAEVGGDFYNGIFRPAKPYESWIWSEDNLWWESSILIPDNQQAYYWDEDSLSWELVNEEYQEHFISGSDTSYHNKRFMPYDF
jgi:hypothetical protein